ncbi:MAG: hypothetical protein IKU35_04710 [Bacteroidaceae bacterium]|nr:hypothetical protein [Bacteroidaceae bacterium]
MKHFLLTTLMAFVAITTSAQYSTWPITLTTADGLPGTVEIVDDFEGDSVITFVTELYKFEEPTKKLRMTVISTNTFDAQKNSYTGTTGGNGPGFPNFTISELKILKGNGKGTNFTATSNAASKNSGAYLEYINDAIYETNFATTSYMGDCPQAYHYIEFEFDEPMSEFRIRWHSQMNKLDYIPTHIGLTPGTEYLPFPEQEFAMGEKVTSVEELNEGGVYVIEGHAPAYTHSFTGTTRTYPGGGFWHSPYGGHVTPNAASAVYLIPVANKSDTYKITWLNNKHFIKANEPANNIYNWTDDEVEAALVKIAPCDTVNGDFIFTIGDSMIIGHEALGRMILAENKADKMNTSRPTAWNFSIHKVSLNASAIGFVLQEVIDIAEERLERLEFEEYDFEPSELLAEIENGKNLLKKSDATSTEVINARNKINKLMVEYSVQELYTYVDSIEEMLHMVENGDIATSSAPNWVIGTYPINLMNGLVALSDNAIQKMDKLHCIGEIDNMTNELKAALNRFWDYKIEEFTSLPIRFDENDGLPGVIDDANGSNVGYIWQSPVYIFGEEITSFRLTVFETNTGNKYGNYDYFSLGELQVYDISGKLVPLTASCFNTNSVVPTFGAGIKGLCDGYLYTFFSSAINDGQDPNGYTGTEGYPYIEVTLPTPMSAFSYKQYGRATGSTPTDTPVKFAIGKAGVALTPDGTAISNVEVDGDEVVSVTYYNAAGASSATPFKNTVNIVKSVYANGAVKTQKRIIK